MIEKTSFSDVQSKRHIHGIKSDHNVVELAMTIKESLRGPGFFKLNFSILKEPQYEQHMIGLINNAWKQNLHKKDIGQRYGFMKQQIVKYN